MNYCKSCGIVLENETAELCAKCAAEQPISNTPELPATENVLAGVVGGFLFSLIGVALYFAIYQVGVIAGIVGLAIFFLTGVGYDLFAKTKGRKSKARLLTCIAATVVMIFVAEYLSVSYAIYDAYKGWGISFFDAVAAVPDFLEEPEISEAMISDLAFAYLFGGAAVISEIVTKKKAEKVKL